MSVKCARHQHGLTMIELVIFIVIISVAVVGVLGVISLTTGRSADPVRQKQALAIAEGLMNEIRSAGTALCDITDTASYGVPDAACNVPDNPGRETATARPYDNVNDYIVQWGQPVAYAADTAGNAFPAGYTATVTVTQPAAFAAVPATSTYLVTVTVSYGGPTNIVLETVRTRY
ncbi:type II secretion system protein [Pseudoduganella chitinolytica]|uniref:Type II secretion system protein n=1 Tax=Pseudoduganella chitinolytica TaxID=34070 RepID=A0ABY8BFV6_9BURK|nr:type II secretion system protein [Pseudoduganella chitinolytica]WEF34784.1 type II secretion system protein [Pseudoduganella chitinolytica]